MATTSSPTCSDFQLPGYEDLTSEVSVLLSGYPPPFVYVHDATSVELTSQVLRSLLDHHHGYPDLDDGAPRICYGHVDAYACLTQRTLYESLIHTLVEYKPTWETGCAIWGSGNDLKWNENMDAFLQGLRAAYSHLCEEYNPSPVRLVLLVEGAERLKDTMAELMVPLARIQELSQLDVCLILTSQVTWDSIKPPLGAAPDPYFIDVSPQPKEVIAQILIAQFHGMCQQDDQSGLYQLPLQQLYSQFVTVLCDVCCVFTRDPKELQYIAAARWPGFVQPVLDDYQQKVDQAKASNEEAPNFESPSEDVRLRLIRLFTASFTAALESLYPRMVNAMNWAEANMPEADLLLKPRRDAEVVVKNASDLKNTLGNLSRMSKFTLVASFLASTNPAKSDLRMFGRGLDEKKRRRRVTKGPGKTKGGVSRIPQRLVGPSPFPLDRLVAILGALLEENDVDTRIPAEELSIPGEYTDMEITRRGVHSSILELTANRLLHQTTKPEQIDGPPTFKCAISYDLSLALAKELKIPLQDLLWEPPA